MPFRRGRPRSTLAADARAEEDPLFTLGLTWVRRASRPAGGLSLHRLTTLRPATISGAAAEALAPVSQAKTLATQIGLMGPTARVRVTLSELKKRVKAARNPLTASRLTQSDSAQKLQLPSMHLPQISHVSGGVTRLAF